MIYKDIRIKDFYYDLVLEDKVVLELKAIKRITDIERAQLLNYLKVTELRVGLIVNFGETSLKHARMVL